MKRTLLLFALVLALGAPALAQNNPIVQTVARYYAIGPLVASGSGCIDLSTPALPFNSHKFIYSFPTGAPNAVTLTVTGATNGGTFNSVTTGTTTAGGTISFDGVYTGLCLTATTMTGGGVTVVASYVGSIAGAGAAVTLSNGADTAEGTTTDAKCTTTDATACTLIGLSKAISANTAIIAAAVVPVSSACNILSTASTNSTNCKASAGNRLGGYVINITATLYYLRLYNTATAPTCSSATGFITSIPIPASTTGSGITYIIPNSVAFATGFGYCVTASSTSTANDNAAAGIFGELYYN